MTHHKTALMLLFAVGSRLLKLGTNAGANSFLDGAFLRGRIGSGQLNCGPARALAGTVSLGRERPLGTLSETCR